MEQGPPEILGDSPQFLTYEGMKTGFGGQALELLKERHGLCGDPKEGWGSQISTLWNPTAACLLGGEVAGIKPGTGCPD